MSKRKHFIVLSGIPGTGKSYLRGKLLDLIPDAHIFSSDDILDEYARINGLTYDQAFLEYSDKSTKIANENLAVAVKNRQNIICDRTNLSSRARRRMISSVSSKFYKKQCIQILPPQTEEELKEWKKRLLLRDEKEGKTIPDNVMAVFLRDFSEAYEDEGFEEVVKLDMFGQAVGHKEILKL